MQDVMKASTANWGQAGAGDRLPYVQRRAQWVDEKVAEQRAKKARLQDDIQNALAEEARCLQERGCPNHMCYAEKFTHEELQSLADLVREVGTDPGQGCGVHAGAP